MTLSGDHMVNRIDLEMGSLMHLQLIRIFVNKTLGRYLCALSFYKISGEMKYPSIHLWYPVRNVTYVTGESDRMAHFTLLTTTSTTTTFYYYRFRSQMEGGKRKGKNEGTCHAKG